MSLIPDSLTSQAMALPPQQRFELAHLLWESIQDDVDEDEELYAEIARREAEIESGAVQTYSHDEVMREVRKVLEE